MLRLVMLVLLSAVTLSACTNTADGMGRDMRQASDNITEATE